MRINYAEHVGIHSVAAAAVFAFIYGPLMAFFIFSFIWGRSLVKIMLAVFCLSEYNMLLLVCELTNYSADNRFLDTCIHCIINHCIREQDNGAC